MCVERSDSHRTESPRASAEGWVWTKLSEASFARDWDNEKDAVYDKWKNLYAAPRSGLRRHR
jgi:hypothetical protein